MTDPFDFSGRCILITGGTRGLGRAMAMAFAQRGAKVIVSGRDADTCAKVERELRALGADAWGIPAHVGRWGAVGDLADKAWLAAGSIDVLINNAGMGATAPTSADMTEALFDKLIAVNLKGPFRLTALLASRMVEAGGGAVINVSSTGAIRPDPSYGVYAAAKAGLNVLTKAQALEFGPTVRVNGIMPGPFMTDMAAAWGEELDRTTTSAAGRIGRPDDIVTAALYLASPASAYTTGSIVTVDGGER
jgi:NAD(P)-dependent dehydrogenase (short-subunit alcohol dehydrogenase family)